MGFTLGQRKGFGMSASGAAPAAPAGHRYWRLNFHDMTNIPSGAPNVAELEMRIAPGGADQCTGGTASSTAVLGGTAANAFDNNAATTWHGGIGVLPSWLKYDFGLGVTKAVIQLSIQAHPSNPAYTPDRFQVQYSDDNSAWTTEWTVTGSLAWGNGEIRIFTKP